MKSKDLRKKALEISAKYPFSPFPLTATNGKEVAESISPKSQHSGCDQEFMRALEKGEHLDTKWS